MSALPDKDQKFQQLTRDIDWQRASFLTHCLEIAKPPAQNNAPNPYSETVVRKILFDYFLLALLYYRNCRLDLEEKYKAVSNTLTESEVKISMQSALDKLISEWYRVYYVITAIRASNDNPESEKLVRQITPVVQAAKEDLGLSDLNVVLQFGQYYSLGFSNYTANITALSIPLMAMDSPWEWTILWHELAGEKARMLKRENPDFFKGILDRALEQLGQDEKSAIERGWSVDWIEELFEDSFSVLKFPIHFLVVFENLMERYADGGPGDRHPSHAVRMAHAMSLQLQNKNKAEQTNLKDWKKDLSIWCATWNELDEKDDLSKFAEFDPHQQLSNSLDAKLAWLVAKELLDWHHHQNKNNDSKFQAVRNAVGSAIKSYSLMNYSKGEREAIVEATSARIEEFVSSFGLEEKDTSSLVNDQVKEQQGKIEKIVSGKLLFDSGVLKALDNLEAKKENQLIKDLLGNLNYRQLLNVAFYDSDFNLEWITDIFLNGVRRIDDFKFGGIWDVEDVAGAIGLQQAVTYKKSGVPHTTTKVNWNNKFFGGPHSL